MKLYLQIVDRIISNVDVEENDLCNVKIEEETKDKILSKVEEYGQLDEEIENKINELLEDDISKESITTYKIKHWISNRSFGELIDMFNCGEIKKPVMQREFVWDSQKSSRLIESIILGLPIPPLFLMEVGNSEYELIDGFQRLTTLTNYVNGNPWGGIKAKAKKRKSRLSGHVMEELKGKSFDELNTEYQRIIKRSTIPLIEFRQIGPEDYSSKYLIFERINTGSEKLNPMQIRKSLSYGTFINSLYKTANSNIELKRLFSSGSVKKDLHVEALLRIIAMSNIYYHGYTFKKSGIKNILNEYCESSKNEIISEEYGMNLSKTLKLMKSVFENEKCMFRKVEKGDNNTFIFVGNLNISVLEAMLGVALEKKLFQEEIDCAKIRENYMSMMYEILEKSFNNEEENPFSVSTGTLNSIQKRFEICEKILGCK